MLWGPVRPRRFVARGDDAAPVPTSRGIGGLALYRFPFLCEGLVPDAPQTTAALLDARLRPDGARRPL